MRRLFIIVLLMLPLGVLARDFKVFGPQGGLYTELSLPGGVDSGRDKCHLVILMHGFGGTSSIVPIPHLRRALLRAGYAVLRFDFDGYGRSEGDILQNTVPLMLEDARAIWEYASALPFVQSIILLGHSQGGLIASMFAGRLERDGTPPSALVLMAPASIIKDYATQGRFLSVTCDPADPPASLSLYGFKVGRDYILSAQTLPIAEDASQYTGPVCLLHGEADKIVPFKCSLDYHNLYSRGELHIIGGCGHLFSFRKSLAERYILNFLKTSLL